MEAREINRLDYMLRDEIPEEAILPLLGTAL